MLREIVTYRSTSLWGLTTAAIGAVLALGAPSAHANEWPVTASPVHRSTLAAPGAPANVARPVTREPLPALQLPLPPYPPIVTGLDGPAPGFQAPAILAALSAEAASRPSALALSALDAAKAEIAASLASLLRGRIPPGIDPMRVASIPDVPPASTPPPLPPSTPPALAPTTAAPAAAPTGVDQAADIWRAAFTKAVTGRLFPRLGKAERQALLDFYDKRGFQPLWYTNGMPNAAARIVLDRLAHAAEEGLDADDYAAAATPPASPGPQDVAEAEWRLSAGTLAYARDARGARVNPTRLSNLVTPTLFLPDAPTVLDALAGTPDAGLALGNFNPRSEGYLNLRAALATLRAETNASQGDGAAADKLASVAPSEVRGGPRGAAVGQAAKRAATAVPAKQLEADIVANMERWRWLPPDLGERHILVNVPEFAVRYFSDGAVAWETRAIVGKPKTPTPIFSGEMTYLVVNPSWYIPPSIIKKEFLPKLAEDPLYAERQGYVVVNDGDHISIRQPPGAKNALGRIKFMFPNRHAVYLHDTPSRSLFKRADRAFSHGCVRVEEPFMLAQYVMNDAKTWPEKRIEKMIGGQERTIRLPGELPVHIAYFTLSADADGTLHRFADLYHYDARLETMLAR